MSRRATGGRAARIAARQAVEQEINPIPRGQIGGQYKPLSDSEVSQVINEAYRVLNEIGMAEVPPQLLDKALEHGAHQRNGRLCFPKGMLEELVQNTPSTFRFYGRDPKYDLVVGEGSHYCTGGAGVQTLDFETGRYRASTLKDLYDFTRLADKMDQISVFTRICVATDLTDNYELDVNTAYALLSGTTKPVGTSFFVGDYVKPIVDMFDIAMGGPGKFRERPFCNVHISPIISPLKYGEDAFDVSLAAIENGMPINAIIAAQSGATAPATIAGMVVAGTAETLAALAMVQLFAPGHPMIFSNWPFVIDLRSGAFCGSGGEIALMNAASAQVSNALGLPSGVAASMADSKAVDAQMGAEKALTSAMTGLAGANMIYESAGMMASLLGVSFEAMVLDNEMLGHATRAIRGIEVNDDTLAFDAIKTAVFGDGHFLGGDHTMSAMERDYYYPELADRTAPNLWNEIGAPDAWSTAKNKVTEILASHQPSYIEPALDDEIRSKFPIKLEKHSTTF
ncbi:MAG: trimethylamine methyltransferase family protein [Alphaproteobacteria bacterium]